jgi:uncharacterized RDD family membrane protein YckC
MEERNLSATLADFATRVTDFMADRRGFPMILGFLLVLLNFFAQFFPGLGWLNEYHVLLHLGLLLAIGGSLLASAL